MRRASLVTFVFFAATFAAAQNLAIKPGLWENVVYGDDGKPSVTALDCVTPSSFAETLAKASKRPGCKMSSQNASSKGITMDVACSSPRVQMTSHSVLEVLDSEHVRNTTTLKMTVKGETKESTMKSAAHFKNSNCGDVKPGDPKITSD